MSTDQHRTLQSAIDYVAQLERRMAQAQRDGDTEAVDRLIGDRARAMLELGVIQTEVQTSVMAKNLGALLQMFEEQNAQRAADMVHITTALGSLQHGSAQLQAEFQTIGETLNHLSATVDDHGKALERHERVIRGMLERINDHDGRIGAVEAQILALRSQLRGDAARMREIGE